MHFTRLRTVLAIMVALLVMGSSSQAAVCELACGLPTAGCHAVQRVAVSMDSKDSMATGAECDHEMKSAVVPVGMDIAGCSQESCGHVPATVFAKGGSAPKFVPMVQWGTTGVMPVDGKMMGGISGGRRPPLLVGNARSSLMSLRV